MVIYSSMILAYAQNKRILLQGHSDPFLAFGGSKMKGDRNDDF